MSQIDKFNARYGNRGKKSSTNEQESSGSTEALKLHKKLKENGLKVSLDEVIKYCREKGGIVSFEDAVERFTPKKEKKTTLRSFDDLTPEILTDKETSKEKKDSASQKTDTQKKKNPKKKKEERKNNKQGMTLVLNEEQEQTPKEKEKEKKQTQEQTTTDNETSEETIQIKEKIKKIKEEKQSTETKKETVNTDERSWQEKYLDAITDISDRDIDKKSDKKRRICKGKIKDKALDIELTPNPETKKRYEKPARYEFQESEQKNKIDVKVKAKQYKDFFILFKAAKQNGVDCIEFNQTQTEEFRTLALAAALSLGLKVKNEPGLINMNAECLEHMPPRAKEALEKHNQSIRKRVERNKERLKKNPIRGRLLPKDDTVVNAADRSPEEQLEIENKLKAEKAAKKRAWENKRSR